MSPTYSEPWYQMNLSGQLHRPEAFLRERTPVPIRWDPGPVWTFLSTEKSVAAVGIRTPDLPAGNLATIPTALSRLFISFPACDVLLSSQHIIFMFYFFLLLFYSCFYRSSLSSLFFGCFLPFLSPSSISLVQLFKVREEGK